jgi:hypothetical protein
MGHGCGPPTMSFSVGSHDTLCVEARIRHNFRIRSAVFPFIVLFILSRLAS